MLHQRGIARYTFAMMKNESTRVIDAIGGTVKVARLCSVTKGAVSQWRDNGIPRARLMYLRLLRPDVFATLDAESPPKSEEKRAA